MVLHRSLEIRNPGSSIAGRYLNSRLIFGADPFEANLSYTGILEDVPG